MRRRLLLLALAHGAALLLFTGGFFLTRFEVPDVSSCRERPGSRSRLLRGAPTPTAAVESASQAVHQDADADGGCWLPARFRRVVLVVVDALRFDFVRSTGDQAAEAAYYLDRLPVLNETLAARPSHSLLFRFVADPPTMTMQRLKGLTTGSLPTFLDIKDNMASSSAIAEDNLLRQMSAQRRGVVFMGDDTWDALYGDSGVFTRKFAFDSFNVKDLDTVDNGVKAHLFPELERHDWDLLIAHFLGVDHVGHTHGPSSVFMAQKLNEMNGVLADLLEALPDDDTLLAVLGDHGMSADGNHGGATDEETGSALFLYSKKPLVDENVRFYVDQWGSEVPQVDLVPTLALLSGLPIPFGNLGSVIPSLFFTPTTPVSPQGEEQHPDRRLLESFQSLTAALQLNVEQVRRYLWTYSSASKLPAQAYDSLERILTEIDKVKTQLTAAQEDVTQSLQLNKKLAAKQQEYLREALALGRSIWTQFDLCSMVWGFALLAWSLVLLAAECRLAAEPVLGQQLHFRGIVQAVIVGGAVYASAIFLPAAHPMMRWLPSSPFSRTLAVLTVMILSQATVQMLQQQSRLLAQAFIASNRGGGITGAGCVAFVAILLHSLALLSNSYIVAEDKVMNFLSETIGFFMLMYTLRRSRLTGCLGTKEVWASVVFIASTRIASVIDPPNIIQSTPTILRTYLPLVVLVGIASQFGVILKQLGLRVVLLRWLAPVFVLECVACAAYWAASPISSALWRLWLPRSVYLSFLAHLVAYWCVSFSKNTNSRAKSASLQLVLFWLLVPCYMLVLGPKSPITVACATLQFLSLAFVARSSSIVSRASTSTEKREVAPSASTWVVIFASVSYQLFFTSGHQNTFTSLQNAAGFVGFDEFQFYIAGALLGLNTFGSFALALLALPWVSDTGRSSALMPFMAVFALSASVSTAFVALQRRHLMVWAIFAPKFIFDGLSLLVVDALALLLTAPSAL